MARPKQITMRNAQQILTDVFGYNEFRPIQKKAIHSLIKGRDTFVLMPTGGGKSLCYQVPALTLKGTAIIVSPLIALMKDQVDSLRANNIAAAYLNSSQDPDEQADTLELLQTGKLTLLYISAERLLTHSFLRLLKEINISLLAIDEAHCISAWGHDFRPDYSKLAKVRTQFPEVPTIALTATADQTTRDDIIRQLELDEPTKCIDSFDRPTITLTVQPANRKTDQIKQFLKDRRHESGIIYCLTRKQTETLAEKLQQQGLSAASYHAGLSTADRSRIQKSFIRDKTKIICATIAFGMGIDKANVRWVIHYSLPKNIEGYYQEIGRAGRDGNPAEALLLYSFSDVELIQKFFIDRTRSALQLAKLERIKEYAESTICRRQTLLRYFGEEQKKKCHNCDVCERPYPTEKTSEPAWLLLQTLQNLSTKNNLITPSDLVDAVSEKNSSIGFAHWHFYLSQLKNHGVIHTNLGRHQALTITPKGQEILQKKKPLRLTSLDAFVQRQIR